MNSHKVRGRVCSGRDQKAMVLLTCLLFLTALTLLGLSATADTSLQLRLTANLKEKQHARQTALSALSWAEDWLLSVPGRPPDSCDSACDGLRIFDSGELPSRPEHRSHAWWKANGNVAGVNPAAADSLADPASGSFESPIWVVEKMHEQTIGDDESETLHTWYRILVRGSSRSGRRVSVIESIVTRPWPITGDSVSAGNDESSFVDTESLCGIPETPNECGRVAWRELL